MTFVLVGLIFLTCNVSNAENIDPDDDDSQYPYGENVGWLNFEPQQGGGVTVSDTEVTGYVWAENIGWINLNPANGGVVNDGDGNLSGYAWGENVGWINFSPTGGGVTIDPDTGIFGGTAYGENIGWINLAPTGGGVKTAWRAAAEVDSDGDGVVDGDDAFPNDPNETLDTDTDGTGDNADLDDDNDGFSDEIEAAVNSDPKDPDDVPADHQPAKPAILGVTADNDTPLTRFGVNLSPFTDPDEGSEPSGTGWKITDAEAGGSPLDVFMAAVGAGDQSELILPSGTLRIAHAYELAVRYKDATGQWSEWSDPFPFTTANADPADTDNDGIDDSAEVYVASDVNSNGVTDTNEGIMVVKEAESGRKVGIKPDSGHIAYVSTTRKSDMSPDHQPTEEMPYGVFSFCVEGLTPGQTIQVQFFLPASLGPRAKWYSIHPVNGLSDVTHLASFDGKVLTLTLTDGGEKDFDGVANGVIVDPSGPASSPITGVGGSSGSCFIDTVGGTEGDIPGGLLILVVAIAGMYFFLLQVRKKRGVLFNGRLRS